MGPWSRSLIAAVVGNTERPDREVRNLRIEPGVIAAEVEGCEVAITAPLIPARIWRSIERYAAGMGALEEAVEGEVQSAHLEHLLQEDWDETLIPRRGQITRACSCDLGSVCAHVAAATFAFAEEIERGPRVLLRWRGVTGEARSAARVVADPWSGLDVQLRAGPRRMPSFAVLKRLGPSSPVGGTEDLAQVLRRAYECLVALDD